MEGIGKMAGWSLKAIISIDGVGGVESDRNKKSSVHGELNFPFSDFIFLKSQVLRVEASTLDAYK